MTEGTQSIDQIGSNVDVVTPAEKHIHHHLGEARKWASREVERLARKILKANPTLTGFCMAMGSASFYGEDGQPLWDGDHRALELDRFVGNWDRELRITGEPMKIAAWDTPIVRNW